MSQRFSESYYVLSFEMEDAVLELNVLDVTRIFKYEAMDRSII